MFKIQKNKRTFWHVFRIKLEASSMKMENSLPVTEKPMLSRSQAKRAKPAPATRTCPHFSIKRKKPKNLRPEHDGANSASETASPFRLSPFCNKMSALGSPHLSSPGQFASAHFSFWSCNAPRLAWVEWCRRLVGLFRRVYGHHRWPSCQIIWKKPKL